MNDLESASSDTKQKIEAAIDDLVKTLATDGYTMRVMDYDGLRLSIGIEASETACPECLVPRELMSDLIKGHLPADILVQDVEIAYPESEK